MRDLCISFISSCFLFPVGRGSKKSEDWGEGAKNFRTGGVTNLGGYFCWGVSNPLHAMAVLLDKHKH